MGGRRGSRGSRLLGCSCSPRPVRRSGVRTRPFYKQGGLLWGPHPGPQGGQDPPFILDCRLAHWVWGKEAFSSPEVLRTYLGDKPCSFKGFPHFSVPYL